MDVFFDTTKMQCDTNNIFELDYQEWIGNGKKWVHDIAGAAIADGLPDKISSRAQLFQISHKASQFSIETVVWAILAWGKMRKNNALRLKQHIEDLKKIAEFIRNNDINRDRSFSLFDSFICEHGNVGMTAAYFTKLIFFLSERHDGYIMDQWTSKSVNLISGKNIVLLNSAGLVSKSNKSSNYIEFCNYIEFLATELSAIRGSKVNGAEIEMALFSKGGQKKLPWREYVDTYWTSINPKEAY
jgi:hypothetical protein